METEVRDRPSFANILVKLEPGEAIVAEADAMASMSTTLHMETTWNGGIFAAILRRIFGGESLFVNKFTAKDAGEIVITQSYPGDIECIELAGNVFFLQPGAYIASEPTVNLGMEWAGFASWIGGEGLFRLKLSGNGKFWFGAYGGIFKKEITDNLVVDTGHLVAYEPSVSMKVGLSGGIFSSFFSGEGLVSRVKGPGTIYLQSRSIEGFAGWINRHLW